MLRRVPATHRHGQPAMPSLNRTPSLSKHARRQADLWRGRVFERDQGACQGCGCPVFLDQEPKASIDHVIPVSRGGSGHPDNLQTMCRGCNQDKGSAVQMDARVIGHAAIEAVRAQ